MKSIRFTTAVLAIIFSTPLIAAPAREFKDVNSVQTMKAGKAKPYPLTTCIVSGDDLEEMGGAVTFIHNGQEIKLCCKPCKKDFKKDPAKYLKQLEGK